MYKILVTGGLGYIGSQFIHRSTIIDNEYTKIDVLDNMYYNQEPVYHQLKSYVNIIKDDVRNFKNWSDYDIIVALHAYVGQPVCSKIDSNEVISVNYQSVVDMIGKLNNQLLIFPSTNSSYGQNTTGVCTEETPLKSLSLYASTKDNAEQEVLKYKNGIAFRLATVCGASPRFRKDLLVNNWCFDAYLNKKLEIFEPHFRRNFININDVCDAFHFAIKYPWKLIGNTHNLGQDDANMTKGQLAEKICKYFNAELKYISGRDSDQRDYEVSSAKLANLGFKAKISIDDCIERLYRYISSHPKHIYSNV